MHYPCPACGATNRIPPERVGDAPKCGRCKGAFTLNQPQEVDDARLAQLVAATDVPVLVDFWAPWCGPCRAVAPNLEKLAARHAGRLLIAKVNTDHHKLTAGQLGVQAIPTLAIYKGGALVFKQAGALPLPQLEALVAPHL